MSTSISWINSPSCLPPTGSSCHHCHCVGLVECQLLLEQREWGSYKSFGGAGSLLCFGEAVAFFLLPGSLQDFFFFLIQTFIQDVSGVDLPLGTWYTVLGKMPFPESAHCSWVPLTPDILSSFAFVLGIEGDPAKLALHANDTSFPFRSLLPLMSFFNSSAVFLLSFHSFLIVCISLAVMLLQFYLWQFSPITPSSSCTDWKDRFVLKLSSGSWNRPFSCLHFFSMQSRSRYLAVFFHVPLLDFLSSVCFLEQGKICHLQDSSEHLGFPRDILHFFPGGSKLHMIVRRLGVEAGGNTQLEHSAPRSGQFLVCVELETGSEDRPWGGQNCLHFKR